jgi:prophage antirepressor-like protein
MALQFELQVFETEDKDPFRTVVIDGEPWFVATDVAKALSIAGDAGQVVRRIDDEDKQKVPSTLLQKQGGLGIWVVNESGLWTLILRSDKPEAKRLKRWVTAEVLPSIRKTGGYGRAGTPKFIRRFNENWDRVSPGHFSVISEMAVRLHGRLEMVGHLMADVAPDGKELRPDTSAGRLFSAWLKENHDSVADCYSMYLHWTPKKEIEARQYPLHMLPLFIEFLETVWIPERSRDYFLSRDPEAIRHLPKLMPGVRAPRPKPQLSWRR